MTPRTQNSQIHRLAAFLASALILTSTLWPGASPVSDRCSPLLLWCGEAPAVDAVLNMALFAPLGWALARLGHGRWRVVVACAVLSATVELVQLTGVANRVPALRDLLANSVGAFAGATLVAWWGRLWRPDATTARQLALGWSVLLTVGAAATGLLLRPTWPDTLWFGQLRADLGGFERFSGQVLEARMGGQPLTSGPLDTAPYRARARDGGLEIEALITRPMRVPSRIAPIVSVYDDRQQKVAMLGAQGRALTLSPFLLSEAAGFQAVVVKSRAIPELLARPRSSVTARYARGKATITIGATDSDQVPILVQRLGPMDWWRLLLYRPTPTGNTMATAIGVGLLFLLLVPLGRWVAATDTGPLTRIAVFGAPAAATLLPIPLGLPPAPVLAWVAVAMGLEAGWRLALWQQGNDPRPERGTRPPDDPAGSTP